jgi:hypothetical protein
MSDYFFFRDIAIDNATLALHYPHVRRRESATDSRPNPSKWR